MKVLEAKFVQDFITMCNDGWLQGWHERKGGNASYRIPEAEVESIREDLSFDAVWTPIGTDVPGLAGEFFLITGSGKFFQNVIRDPEASIAVIEVAENGSDYRIVWGLRDGGKPTSELPTHLMNHEVKKRVTNGQFRVIYHGHPVNLIAMTFILPLKDEIFTRELWEMMTECPVIFPEGVGVVPWMVPGGRAIGVETSKLMEEYNVAVWAHHGLFCASDTFDNCFGMFHAVEKAAEIYMKVASTGKPILSTIQPEGFRALAKDFDLTLPEKFLFEKEN